MIDCPLRLTATGAFSLVRAPHDVRGNVRRTGTVDDRYRRLNPMSLRGHEPTSVNGRFQAVHGRAVKRRGLRMDSNARQ